MSQARDAHTRIVFLDVDGVLNSIESCKRFGTYRRLDPACVAHLQRIIDQAGAAIVVSSTWRVLHGLDGMRTVLAEAGLRADVIDVTPFMGSVRRRIEIGAWLVDHPEVTSWCSIDDGSDAGPDRLVLTKFEVGLTRADADAAIAILNAG